MVEQFLKSLGDAPQSDVTKQPEVVEPAVATQPDVATPDVEAHPYIPPKAVSRYMIRCKRCRWAAITDTPLGNVPGVVQKPVVNSSQKHRPRIFLCPKCGGAAPIALVTPEGGTSTR